MNTIMALDMCVRVWCCALFIYFCSSADTCGTLCVYVKEEQVGRKTLEIQAMFEIVWK